MCGDTNNLSSVNLGRTEHATWCNMPIVLSVIMFMHVSLTIRSMSCTPNANCNRQELLPEKYASCPVPGVLNTHNTEPNGADYFQQAHSQHLAFVQ